MSIDLKPYRYITKENPALDAEFSDAVVYENVKLGHTHLFWKPMFRWHVIPIAQASRIFRRIQDVQGRLCCGGRSFRMENLVLILDDSTELEIHIGDDVGKKAQALLEALQNNHPNILYGKP